MQSQSAAQYGLYCKQIISTKSAQYFLLPQKKPHTFPKILGHSMQLIQSSTITLPTIRTTITPDHSAEPSPSRSAL